MADTLHLQIATPERQLVDQDVSEVQLPGKDGYIGILPQHAPLLGILGSGLVTYSGGSNDRAVVVTGGFVEVLDNQVRLLADRAEFVNEVNVDEAQKQLAEAQDLVNNPKEDTDMEKALDQVRAAQARIDAAGHS